MNKTLLIAISVLVVLVIITAGLYFFWPASNKYGPPPPKKDLTNVIVPPVTFPLAGKVFQVPNTENISVTLDLVAPSAKRDYPMGRYDAGDGINRGSLVAMDDFTTENINGRRAVPIAVNQGGSGEFVYLAIMDEVNNELTHATSVPLGDRIKIRQVSHEGPLVKIDYYVHGRYQAMAEVPKTETAAIVDISNGQLVQAGRNPMTEELILTKSFTGIYTWEKTKYEDGTIVEAQKPGQYTLTFNANQIELGTDCNSGSAVFSATTGSSSDFTIGDLAVTTMFCDATQETDYFAMVKKIATYSEDNNGNLTFNLTDKPGLMYFSPKKRDLKYETATSTEIDESTSTSSSAE